MKLDPLAGTNNEYLFVDPKTGIIYVRRYKEGKGELCRSLRTKSKTEARAARDKILAAFLGEAPKRAMRETVGELWAPWYQGKAETKSYGTAKSIDATWKNSKSYIADKFPDELTDTWWETVYIPGKRAEISPKFKRKNPKRKFANDRKWLMAFLKHLHRNGKLERLPLLKNPDPPRDSGKVYLDDEMARLLDNADWRLMIKIVMGSEHFMRRSEVTRLSKDRIDRKRRIIHLRAQDTKIRKARTFPYNEALEWLFVINDWLDAKAKITSPFVFPSPINHSRSIGADGFIKSWKTCKRNAAVKGTFHHLRHTGLTKAFKAPGANAALICHFAGLSLEEAQRTYLHFTTEDIREVASLVSWTPSGVGENSGSEG